MRLENGKISKIRIGLSNARIKIHGMSLSRFKYGNRNLIIYGILEYVDRLIRLKMME